MKSDEVRSLEWIPSQTPPLPRTISPPLVVVGKGHRSAGEAEGCLDHHPCNSKQ